MPTTDPIEQGYLAKKVSEDGKRMNDCEEHTLVHLYGDYETCMECGALFYKDKVFITVGDRVEVEREQ